MTAHEQKLELHNMIHEVLSPCIANLNAITARLQASNIRLRAKLAELRQLRQGKHLRAAMGSKRSLLPKWKKLKASQRLELEAGEIIEFAESRAVRTEYLRRDYLERDVAYLRQLVAMPYFIAEGSAEAAYNRGHVRTMKPKRLTADPDISCPDWRSRPERHLTARQLIEQQLSGKALLKELKRLR